APYSAPQTAASLLPPARNFDSATGAASRLPMPFVPREFRTTLRADVTVVPVMERVEASSTSATEPVAAANSIALLFNDDVAPAPDFSAFVESHGRDLDAEQAIDSELDDSDSANSAELPWIDAFAADVPESEESWPLGEAGKRLDELTQSLSSLDASRERQQAAERQRAAADVQAEAKLPMWNEEEWIDIMPTLPVEQVSQENLNRSAAQSGKHNAVNSANSSANERPSASVNAESAARELEGLARRVRAGEVQVPEFPTELGTEAMLAGLLASMLGWRQ
ncbi:MAG: hypothetical protein ABI120_05590, partial [Gemmatimonadaceae bacterium]